MITAKEISNYIETFAPYSAQCDWDNSGLLVGDINAEVKKAGFALDLTPETLEEAKKAGTDLIITHHPVIFRAQKSFLSGSAAFEAAKSGMTVISAHTCFDCAEGGVNDVLCDLLDIENAVGVESAECKAPMVRIGDINETTAKELAFFVSQRLCAAVRLVDSGKTIKRAAVCGGAGMSLLPDVIAAGADAYITGDISHHEMLEAKERGITVVAAGHFETERPAALALGRLVKKKFPDLECVVLNEENPAEYIKCEKKGNRSNGA